MIGALRGGVVYGATALETNSVMVTEMIAFGPIAKKWAGFITAIGVTAGIGISKDSVCKTMHLSDISPHQEKAVAAGEVLPSMRSCTCTARSGRKAMHANI